ncbi:glucose PTS transporter subunit IIA [Mycoplasmopsis ciconiae]|uniref:Glucose PTS transporter subunit IIA n=1 Tax=Mycoplasmopsis ciconiae TaxID=561067 RepID=A0ABU7MMI9_9BACT|nr:glucose PTS transporter subunit IIA [Mycoplasmopsis ciconiae]
MKTLAQKFQDFKLKKSEKRAKDNSNSGKTRKILSKISGSFMLPIAVMAIAGLFLGVGATIQNAGITIDPANLSETRNESLILFGKFIENLGQPVFSALPLLFAASFVIAFTDDAGVAVFSTIIAYMTFSLIQSVFITDYKFDELLSPTQKESLDSLKEQISKLNESFNSAEGLNGSKLELSDNIAGYKILFEAGGRDPLKLKALVGTTLGVKTLQTSVFGGITIGLLVSYLYNKFHTIQLPSAISFFGGKRFVAIIVIPAAALLAVIFLIFWPWVGIAFNLFGSSLSKIPYGFESFAFGYIERSLIPFGLHHVFYSPLWYSEAGGSLQQALEQFQKTYPEAILGPQLQKLMNLSQQFADKFKGDSTGAIALLSAPQIIDWTPKAGEAKISMPVFDFVSKFGYKIGRFTDGKFSVMIFGLPAAALAMVFAAPKETRKIAIGTVLPAGFTSMLTGVTEPIEFTFLMLAPWLFWGFHAFFCGVSFMAANLLGVHIPMAFSGGLLDLLIYGIIPVNHGTNFYWVLVVGLFYAPLYFFAFYFFIKKFNLETPGRGSNTKLFSKADFITKGSKQSKVDPKALAVVVAYGGLDNITAFNNCASRLRYDVVDASKVDIDALKAAGANGVKVEGNNHVQAIFGPQAEQLNSLIKSQKEAIREYLSNNKVEKVEPQVQTQEDKKVKANYSEELSSPAVGIIKDLSTLEDGVFSEKMSGDGFVVEHTEQGKAHIYSPVDGFVSLVFPTKHAYGISTEDGLNILLHSGIDTVTLDGQGFEAHVSQDQKIKAGDLIATVDLDFVKSKNLKSDLVVCVLPDSSITKVKMLADVATEKTTKVAKVY